MAHVCSTKGSQVNDYQTDNISSYNLTWTSEFAHGSLGLANSTFCHINALFPLGGGVILAFYSTTVMHQLCHYDLSWMAAGFFYTIFA